jgi:hypothetical protein
MKPLRIVTTWILAALWMVGLAWAIPAQADVILIDFGTDSSWRGLSVVSPDANGNYWNTIAPGAYYPDLVDIDNNATTIDFGFSSGVGTDSYNGPAGATDTATLATDVLNTDIDAAALGNLGVINAAFDFVAENVTFEIQGLDPTKLYNLTFFGSHKFNTDTATMYSVFTDNTYSTLVDTVSLNVHESGSPWLHNRDTVATISNLAPQTADILYVRFAGSDGDFGYLNAMQIEVVPEPSTLMMAVLGFILLGVRRAVRR